MTKEKEDIGSTTGKGFSFEEAVFKMTQKNNEIFQLTLIQEIVMNIADISFEEIRGLTTDSFGMLSVYLENHSIELTSSILVLLELITFKAFSANSVQAEDRMRAILKRSLIRDSFLKLIVARRTPIHVKNIIARILGMECYDLSFEEEAAIINILEMQVNRSSSKEELFLTCFSLLHFIDDDFIWRDVRDFKKILFSLIAKIPSIPPICQWLCFEVVNKLFKNDLKLFGVIRKMKSEVQNFNVISIIEEWFKSPPEEKTKSISQSSSSHSNELAWLASILNSNLINSPSFVSTAALSTTTNETAISGSVVPKQLKGIQKASIQNLSTIKPLTLIQKDNSFQKSDNTLKTQSYTSHNVNVCHKPQAHSTRNSSCSLYRSIQKLCFVPLSIVNLQPLLAPTKMLSFKNPNSSYPFNLNQRKPRQDYETDSSVILNDPFSSLIGFFSNLIKVEWDFFSLSKITGFLEFIVFCMDVAIRFSVYYSPTYLCCKRVPNILKCAKKNWQFRLNKILYQFVSDISTIKEFSKYPHILTKIMDYITHTHETRMRIEILQKIIYNIYYYHFVARAFLNNEENMAKQLVNRKYFNYTKIFNVFDKQISFDELKNAFNISENFVELFEEEGGIDILELFSNQESDDISTYTYKWSRITNDLIIIASKFTIGY
ncbi:uncharacterized protein MONOS_18646 [Monocercomonoides exilis]|uniref:uncharacterized protein n=1 Tax=Monocercomonoides exilis TaxID=2049356 RepID=UPI003559C247|nr:hypothetical protein MONOS_18646 [Monocercomonoides exilis]